MYALRTNGKIVAKATREYLRCLMIAFHDAPKDLTLVNHQGRVLLTARHAATMSNAERSAAIVAAEGRIYLEQKTKYEAQQGRV